MLSLRSAQGRAILASVVLVVLLTGMATLAVWRTSDVQQRHDALERTSGAAAAMERAHAQFRREQAAILSSLVFPDDPTLLDEYHDAAASLEQDLSQARAAALAEGDADQVVALDDLTDRIGQFNGQVDSALPVLLASDPETRLQLVAAARSEMWSEAEGIVAGLQQLAQEEQEELAASRAAADRAADTTLWLLVGFGTAAFLVAAGTVAMPIVSVVRPLASLRASARAISAGDSEARARVSGPEEIVSLARDFNEMADTLAAKTQEYIDTANLTGDIIVRTDKDNKFTFLNDAACQFFGGSREELLGARFTDYLHPDDAASTAEAIQETIENKQPVRGFINRYVTPIATRVVEWNAYPLFDEEDQFVGWQATGRDITERKQAEERLRASEEEWRSLAENAPNIIVIADQDGTIQFVNRTVSDITVEETIGKTVYDFVQPEYHDILKKSINQVFQTGEVGTYQVVGTGPGGRAPWYETQFGPIKRDGRVVAATLITTDISERKRAEEALRESEARYKALFTGAPEGMLVADSQTRQFRYANPAMCMMFGYTEEEFLRIGVGDIHPKESLDHALAEFEAQARGERRLSPGLPCLRKDGTLFYADIRSITVVLDGRKCSVGIFSDITERKRAEEALRESETKYRTLLSNLPQKIFFKDKNSVYVSCNDNYARDLHILPDEIAGKTDHDFYPQELADKYRADDKRIMASGNTEDIEERYLQNGQETFVHTVKTPVRDEKGNVIGILGIFWDVSERRKMEQEQERLHAELEIRAITDSLTGLYDHAHFFQRLGEEIERSSRYGRGFSILMMDVDNFKHYNDTRGHQAGDEALRLIADCVRTAIRRSDIAFRYGGDEFAAILVHADSPRAQTIIKRMSRYIAERLKEANNPAAAWLGLSAGVACFPDDATTSDDLVRVADAALYCAKRAARDRSATRRGQPTTEASASPPETPDCKEPGALSAAARELAATLQELSLPDAPAELDLRTIAAVGAAAEIKDPHIRRHQERVSQWAAALAEQMGLPSQQVQDIRIASLLHDLGKVSIEEHILNKPCKLTEPEYTKIKEHPALGAMIVAQVDGLHRLAKIIRHHHERFDGNGYPDGLARHEIPVEARILAVADVFDAMTHERSYRKALTRAKALAELERSAGTQFDPAVVRAFLALLKTQGEEPAAAGQGANMNGQLAPAKVAGRGKR